MTIDEERLEIERERLSFERSDTEHERCLRERDFKEQRKSRIWSQIATFVPIIGIIIGFYVNLRLDASKQANADHSLATKVKRDFIDRQLAELYYPIRLRLEKDTATWTLSRNLSGRAATVANPDFDAFIEYQILLPNHEEVVKIIDNKFALLKNGDEIFDQKKLLSSIGHYQRHVAAFRALRSLKILVNPIDVCKDCDFPTDFPKLVASRIEQLELQRATLLSQLSSH